MEVVDQKPAEGSDNAFSEIAGFSLRTGATVLKNKSKPACENLCLKEPKCRSFSYRKNDKLCIWSISSLIFDPDFIFAAKTSLSKRRAYRKFSGMAVDPQGWTIVGGRTLDACEAMCTPHPGCKAYSYRSRDKLCLLGPKGIVYSDDFNYYERKGLKKLPFPMPPPGGKCTGSLCALPPKPAGAAAAPNPTNDPALKALEGAVKAREKAAAKDMMKAKIDDANAKAKIAEEEKKASEKIHKLKSKDRSQLTAEERALLDKGDEKLAKQQEIMKLQFADAEMKQKALEASGGAARAKERSTKQAFATSDRAKQAAEREVKEGGSAAEMERRKKRMQRRKKMVRRRKKRVQRRKKRARRRKRRAWRRKKRVRRRKKRAQRRKKRARRRNLSW